DKGYRQDGQYHQRQLPVGEQQNDEGGDQQQERLRRQHQPLRNEQTNLFHVVGGADHQLSGLVLVVVAEREPLNLGENLVAEVEGDTLRSLFCHVRLHEREQRTSDGKNDDEECSIDQPRFGIRLICL